MATISAFLVKKTNSKNLHPISIRITKDRKPVYIYLGQAIEKVQWDIKNGRVKTNHPDALEINQLILSTLSKLNKGIIDLQLNGKHYSALDVKKNIVIKKTDDFFSVAQIYLNGIKAREKYHQLDIESKRIEVFRRFAGCRIISFAKINKALIIKFANYLLIERDLKKRTVANYLITLRTIFNIAISNSIVEPKYYPFGKGKYIIRFPETNKIGLSKCEIKTLEELSGLTKAQSYALRAWLFSFYFAGMRISDVLQLKWKDFVDDRLNYTMNKNCKIVSLKIPMKVKNMLSEMKNEFDSVYVFRCLEDIDIKDKKRVRTRIKTVTRNFNRRLKTVAEIAGIDKKLTMHIARHSFGNISGELISIQLLQKLYRHSSVTTTVLYQSNFIQNDLDEALEKVVDF